MDATVICSLVPVEVWSLDNGNRLKRQQLLNGVFRLVLHDDFTGKLTLVLPNELLLRQEEGEAGWNTNKGSGRLGYTQDWNKKSAGSSTMTKASDNNNNNNHAPRQLINNSSSRVISRFVAERPADLVEEDDHITNEIYIVSRGERQCKRNAIVILAQKQHSSYHRDSYGPLLDTFELLKQNYLSIDNHQDNVDVFLFHTGDFDESDIPEMEAKLSDGSPNGIGMLKLVNLEKTVYWYLPRQVRHEDPSSWRVPDLFSVGYRHMCRWFAILIWKFFEELNAKQGCQYKYIMRVDEDSYIHSPISYDIFDMMERNQYNYGFRLCAYELDWNRLFPWMVDWHRKANPVRRVEYDLCGFYNNFCVANVEFFRSEPVKAFLQDLDEQGLIYRERYGDLNIHSTAVYAFSPPEAIHRFLDFTYRHHTIAPTPKGESCVAWGAMQAGYNDPHAETTLNEYFRKFILTPNCDANVTYMTARDLSPSYQHLPKELEECGRLSLKTIYVGKVELPHQGILSG